MINNNDNNATEQDTEIVENESMPDENMHLFVYGNILIKDPESGDILVNKSF
jgi:hypothetical protein